MIKDCHSFERRIQQLMDSRIDPETDEALWQHGADCPDCHQTLMACSLMHSEFLNDSDSMKIKLETIGLQDLRIRHQEREQKPRISYIAAIAASLAAILLVSISLMPTPNDGNVIIGDLKSDRIDSEVENPLEIEHAVESFKNLRSSLDPFQLTSMTTDWHPIKSLSVCFDWIQRSWRRKETESEEPPDFGDLQMYRQEILYADTMLLACRG